MEKHLARLGLASPRAYLDWCSANKFPETTDKGPSALQVEVDAWESGKRSAERARRVLNDPKAVIMAACRGEVTSGNARWHAIISRVAQSPTGKRERAALEEFLLWVEAETDLLFESFTFGGQPLHAINGLIAISARRNLWLRPLGQWRSPSHNARKQFASLLRHLFARYDVPLFLDGAWLRGDERAEDYRQWFRHIGTGGNIRAANTPIPLTKMMAHHFVRAPDQYSVEAALQWGQIHALGGRQRLVESWLGTRAAQAFAENEFWCSVIRFLVANPMLDRSHVGPIVDYLHAQRYERRIVRAPGGEVIVEGPPQPNLCMRGRTPDTLLAQVERWHVALGKVRVDSSASFPPSGIREFSHQAKGGRGVTQVWTIRELRGASELIAEGRAMRHCVASYASSCASGRCSIWSMELFGEMGLEKKQTIEVTRDRAIVQCRGRLNRLPTEAELNLIGAWARAENLRISPYIRASE